MHKLLMIASGWLMAAAGLVLTLAPKETAAAMGYPGAGGVALLVQLLGALYVGFAIVNWMGKNKLTVPAFGKSVALGNFVHFAMAGFSLLRVAYAAHNALLWSATVICAFLAACFGIVSFGGPYYKPKD
jgi:hypothetical protein